MSKKQKPTKAPGPIDEMVELAQKGLGKKAQPSKEDRRLIKLVMGWAYVLGYKPMHIETFTPANGNKSRGFNQNDSQYCAISTFIDPLGGVQCYCVTVRSVMYEGLWKFFIRPGNKLVIKRNRQVCTEFNGLEGEELMEAVVKTSLRVDTGSSQRQVV